VYIIISLHNVTYLTSEHTFKTLNGWTGGTQSRTRVSNMRVLREYTHNTFVPRTHTHFNKPTYDI
jgi:hypothetical protein